MTLYGLTGGMCSGKSIVAERFKQAGYPLVKVDDFLYESYQDPWCKKEINALFDEDVYTSDKLDHKKLKQMLINEPEKTRLIWEITDTYISPRIEKRLIGAQGVFEAAQLFEKGWDTYCDKTILVMAPLEQRIERLCKRVLERDGFTPTIEQAKQALAQQPTFERDIADYTLWNDKSLGEFHKKIDDLLSKIGQEVKTP